MINYELESEWYEAAIFESELHELAIYDAGEWEPLWNGPGTEPSGDCQKVCNFRSHVESETVQYFLETIARQAIAENRSKHILFRCRRQGSVSHVCLSLAPNRAGRVSLQGIVVHTDLWDRQDLSGDISRQPDEFLTVCSWCRSAKFDSWMDATKVLQELRLFELRKPPILTHGICEPCSQRALDSLIADRKGQKADALSLR